MKVTDFWCRTCGYVWRRVTDPKPITEINHGQCPACHAGKDSIVKSPDMNGTVE